MGTAKLKAQYKQGFAENTIVFKFRKNLLLTLIDIISHFFNKVYINIIIFFKIFISQNH